jgi:hypothetical protein
MAKQQYIFQPYWLTLEEEITWGPVFSQIEPAMVWAKQMAEAILTLYPGIGKLKSSAEDGPNALSDLLHKKPVYFSSNSGVILSAIELRLALDEWPEPDTVGTAYTSYERIKFHREMK